MSFRFAFASADITPLDPTELSGFASRHGHATGTLDPLTVRTLLMGDRHQTVAIAAFDLLGIPDGLGEAIAALCPLAVRIIPCATHTHAAPPVLAHALLGAVPAGYVAHLAAVAASAIRDAIPRLQPGTIAHRKVEITGIARNRRDPDGPADHAVDVTILTGANGGNAAIWLNFACHPVVLGPDNLRYSADFPGAARRALEQRLSVPVLYTTGCAGQINLGHSALDSIRRIGLDRRTPAEAGRIGNKLATEIHSELARGFPTPAAVDALRLAEREFAAGYAIPNEASRIELEMSARRVLADPAMSPGERRMAEIDIRWLATPHVPAALKISVLRAGPLRCVFLPGEIFVETSLSLQNDAPGTIVVGYAHSNPGYIPHPSALGLGGYEVDVAWRPYGAPGPFAADTADRVEEIARTLLATVERPVATR